MLLRPASTPSLTQILWILTICRTHIQLSSRRCFKMQVARRGGGVRPAHSSLSLGKRRGSRSKPLPRAWTWTLLLRCNLHEECRDQKHPRGKKNLAYYFPGELCSKNNGILRSPFPSFRPPECLPPDGVTAKPVPKTLKGGFKGNTSCRGTRKCPGGLAERSPFDPRRRFSVRLTLKMRVPAVASPERHGLCEDTKQEHASGRVSHSNAAEEGVQRERRVGASAPEALVNKGTMLESYVTPILMSYVNRYIKNLKPSDLQLSLWGGDVVLSKLELKLDVLEQELKLPFTFLSGHIHELRIHVPWTKLGSEPVVITINTMECILKLKDGLQDDHESCGSSSTNRSTTEGSKTTVKPRKIQQTSPDPDLPPGYVQSLIWRVINNVNIVINNLILKYVEDDIVLSVNITSAECYTVDEFWDRAFMDISATDLVLRKVINFSDCTVCLDKRNASGKIEFYQDPLLYKCSFRTRLHFTYDNLNSKMPSIIKVHTLVESLKLSITDQQLPMFIRIMQLVISLYYGEIGNFKDGESEDPICHTKDILGNISGAEDEIGKDISPEFYIPQDDDQQQGWVSWAWSFVPAIVSTDSEDSDDVGVDDGTMNQQKSPIIKDPIVSIGFYCTKATITFKLTEMQAESSYYSPQKVKSKEIICWQQEGTTIEALMRGEPFFNCQIGFVGCQALCLKGIMGVKDFEENRNRSESEACFFHCGENLSTKGMTYLTNSLFDYRSPENNGVRAEFILDAAAHKEMYTEITGMQRFGAFYMDYLYTMESTSGKGSGNQPDVTSVKIEDFIGVQEMSTKSLIIGPLSLRLDSSAVHRIIKMIVCALEHEYEPYSKSKLDFIEGAKVLPSTEEAAALEEYIPTRITTFSILKCTVTIPMAEFNLLAHLLPVIMGQKSSSNFLTTMNLQLLRPLPCIRILVDKMILEHSVPMYADQLVQYVNSLNQPSDNLLHYCYMHCYLKIFGFQAGLTSLDINGCYSLPTSVIPQFSTAIYGKMLKLPNYWSKRSNIAENEFIFELPNLTIQATRAQNFLMQTIWQKHTFLN
ncbi:vacuolar protein sorting-associated protein 13B [Crotalus adamanteus]|uniref:Vacuolar protein sorting-associated protein 13B n=1 Tax=Crotalus adamanteus TaxID=8729 RepID=A0AAW1BNU9_CROAD